MRPLKKKAKLTICEVHPRKRFTIPAVMEGTFWQVGICTLLDNLFRYQLQMAPTVRPRYQQVLSKGELSIYKTWIVCTQVTSSKPQGFGYYSKFGLILSENPKKSRPKTRRPWRNPTDVTDSDKMQHGCPPCPRTSSTTLIFFFQEIYDH